MLRVQISEALKSSMKAKEKRATSTLRLIRAALKDRDIAARGKGGDDELSDDEILGMLQKMIKQRHESVKYYEQGERPDLAKEEAEEIEISERCLPKRLEEKATTDAISAVIDELGAANIKDMGRTMAALKQSYAGRMDFSKVNTIVKQRLGGV